MAENKNATKLLPRGVALLRDWSRRNCLARRHWNSPSYRAAAGKHPLGENYAEPNMFTQRWLRVSHGADRDRTGDLCSAIAALSQLSYSPAYECAARGPARRRTMEKAPRTRRGRFQRS